MIGILNFDVHKNTQMIVEVCCNSLESALNAQEGGADRIELCAELGVGGVTPSYGLIKKAKEALKIPIHVLIRPRSGHFSYSDNEFEVMLEDIAFCKEMGVAGIVSGALIGDASLDEKGTKRLIAASGSLHFTFHRAFDWIVDTATALRQLEGMGVDTVLTSGQAQKALDGIAHLREWQKITGMTIMAGSGVSVENVAIFKEAGLRAIHFSGVAMQYRIAGGQNVSFNSQKLLKEDRVPVTNAHVVRQITQRFG